MANERSMSPNLLNLPFELLNEVFQELDKTDLQRLRLACRALSKSRSIQEKLFDTLHIPLHWQYTSQTHVRSLLSFCAAVKSGRTDIASYVRCLVIQGEYTYLRQDIGKAAHAKRKLKALFSPERRLVKALIEILPRLNGVRILQLSYVHQANFINKPLMDGLTSMPSVSEVMISRAEFRAANEPLLLSDFRDLKRVATIATLNNTELTSILRHSGRTLTHLSCTGIVELQSANVSRLWRGSPLSFVSTYYDFPASMWKAFSASGICLEHVLVRHTIQRTALLEYLDSYSGLHGLSIRVASAESLPHEVLQNFFTKTLSKHKETITSIDIVPMSTTSWSCDAQALLALNQCTRLSLLRVNIDPTQSSNPITVFLDLLPSWCSLSEVEFYTPDETMAVGAETVSAAVVDRVLAFRNFHYTYAMKMLSFHCLIWKITPKVFENNSYGFSATVCLKGHPHDGEPYGGSDQYVRALWSCH